MVGPEIMLPVVQNRPDPLMNLEPPGRESSQETNGSATWLQMKITGLPPEVLRYLFGFLRCEDLVRVHDTCRRFQDVVATHYPNALRYFWSRHITLLPDHILSRIFLSLEYEDIGHIQDTCRRFQNVLQSYYPEVSFYSRLSGPFRKQYQQSWPCQQRIVEEGRHPFAPERLKEWCRYRNTRRHAALMCFYTVGIMMNASGYLPVEVFARTCPGLSSRVYCSLDSCRLVRQTTLSGGAYMLGPDRAGLWSEQEIELDDSGFRLLNLQAPNRDGTCCANISVNTAVEYLKHGHYRWRLINQPQIKESDFHAVSPSGEFVAIYNASEGIEGIMCLDDQGQCVLMPMADGVLINARIIGLRFSPSGKRLAIRYEEDLAILSLDNRGCWNVSWTTSFDEPLSYVEFDPSERWLLMGFCGRNPKVTGSAEIVGLDPSGSCISRQRIACINYQLTFSPGGNYLVSHREGKCYPILWRLLLREEWGVYGNLADPGAGPLPVEQMDLVTEVMAFGPCDNYLLISSSDGKAKIWGQNSQGRWKVRGSQQHDGAVKSVQFSESGIHALTVDQSSIHIWGRGENGLWSVKGIIPDDNVISAHFHPSAEHLVVSINHEMIRIWEIRKDDSKPDVRERFGRFL